MKHRPSRTAEYVAWLRALEHRRPSGLLSDPYAHQFLPSPLQLTRHVGRLRGLAPDLTGLTTYIVARHRWMDERLKSHLSDIEQVLVLGAGYDTRARRIGGARYWEVDHPATSRRKRSCDPDWPAVSVPVDFEVDDLTLRLCERGFSRGAPTFVIWEGVTMYLTRAALHHTLGQLDTLVGPDSHLVLDALSLPDGNGWRDHVQRLAAALMPLVGEPVTSQPHPEDLSAVLQRHGWALNAVRNAKELARDVGTARRVFEPAYVIHAERGS